MTTDDAFNIVVYRSLTQSSSEPTKSDKPGIWLGCARYHRRPMQPQSILAEMALELRGRLQPGARGCLKHFRRLIDRARKSDVHENDLGHARIAIAPQIVGR